MAKKAKEEITKELSKEETEVLKEYQIKLNQEKHMLAELVLSEKKVVSNIENLNEEIMSYLKMIMKQKNISENEKWMFDPLNSSFKKIEE